MPRTTGYVDNDGEPRERIEFNLKSAWDMIRLKEILKDPAAGAIKESFGDKKAVITVRSDW